MYEPQNIQSLTIKVHRVFVYTPCIRYHSPDKGHTRLFQIFS